MQKEHEKEFTSPCRECSQSELSAEKLATRHFDGHPTRNFLVKGEEVVGLQDDLPLHTDVTRVTCLARFCISFGPRVSS
jgi:hypothetical protein